MALRAKASGGEPPPPVPAPETPPPPRRLTAGTAQQEALWRELVGGEAHVLVEARAGSGKSSSCREAMWRMLERRSSLKVRYAVFNKANADEFRGSCPPGVDVGTLHAFGFGACRQAFRSELDKNKTYLALDESRSGRSLQRWLRKSIAQVVSQAKNQNAPLPPDEEGRPSEFDAYAASLAPLLVHYDIRSYGQPDRVCQWAARVLRRAGLWSEVVDFDDMIWLPALHQLPFPESDCVFVDECQDLNPAQHALVPLLAGGGRVVAVGDRYQSIYAFRGADHDSIPNLERQLAAAPRGLAGLPLTVTFRCPRSHVRLANAFVADLEAHATNAEGVLEYDRSLDDVLTRAVPGDRVICPANAPMVQAALRMIAQKKRAFVRGRALGDQLVTVVHSCGERRTVADLARGICEWKARELAHLEGLDGVEDVVESVTDRAAGLLAILSACDSPAEVEPLIRDLFTEADQQGAVHFSTVHRAKGLEAGRVWLIQTPLREPRREWERQQQANLMYVALTRSKDTLAFVNPEP